MHRIHPFGLNLLNILITGEYSYDTARHQQIKLFNSDTKFSTPDHYPIQSKRLHRSGGLPWVQRRWTDLPSAWKWTSADWYTDIETTRIFRTCKLQSQNTSRIQYICSPGQISLCWWNLFHIHSCVNAQPAKGRWLIHQLSPACGHHHQPGIGWRNTWEKMTQNNVNVGAKDFCIHKCGRRLWQALHLQNILNLEVFCEKSAYSRLWGKYDFSKPVVRPFQLGYTEIGRPWNNDTVFKLAGWSQDLECGAGRRLRYGSGIDQAPIGTARVSPPLRKKRKRGPWALQGTAWRNLSGAFGRDHAGDGRMGHFGSHTEHPVRHTCRPGQWDLRSPNSNPKTPASTPGLHAKAVYKDGFERNPGKGPW